MQLPNYAPDMPRAFLPLRDRRFARYAASAAISFVGDGLYLVALAWFASGLGRPLLALSVVGSAATLPQLIAALAGGSLADRFDRRNLLVAVDVARFLFTATIGLLALTGSLGLVTLTALVGCFGLASAIATPTTIAYVPRLVSRDELHAANALLSMTRMIGQRVVGTLLGGVVVVAGGTAVCFLADAATFLLSAGLILGLPPARTAAVRTRTLRHVAEGLRYVRSVRWLAVTLAASSLSLLFYVGPFQVLTPLLVRGPLHGNARSYALFIFAGGVGAFAASALAGQLSPRRPIPVVYGLFLLSLGTFCAYGIAPSLGILMACTAVSIGAGMAGGIVWQSLLQTHVPDEVLGRVASLDTLATFGLVPLSMAVAGWAGSLLGIRAAVVVEGVLASAVLVVGFLFLPREHRHPQLRRRLPSSGSPVDSPTA